MNKKILSLMITFVMVTASFTMAFAAAPTDVVGTPVEEAVERLVELGVITGYPDGTFRPEENIQRAEYAAVATRAIGLEQLTISKKGPTNFGDVTAGGWSSGYINVAEQEGLIKGKGIVNGVNTFAPSANIKYEEAVTIMVRALGYEQAAIDKGGYSKGHLLVAAERGLLQGVNGSKGTMATRGLVAQLTYNALEVPMMIKVGASHIISGTQGTDPVYLFNDLHLINQAAASGNWGSIDKDTFADAGITGVTANNLANLKNKLQSLANGNNKNWSPEDIQGVIDSLVIVNLPAEVTYINTTNIALDNVVYTFNSSSILYSKSGLVVATGGSAIDVLIDKGDIVEDIMIDSGILKSMKLKRDISAEAAAVLALPLTTDAEVAIARAEYEELTVSGKLEANAVTALANIEAAEAAIVDGKILALPALSVPPTAAEKVAVGKVRTAYEALTANAKTLVVPANLAILVGYEATIDGAATKAKIAALPNPANTATLADKTDTMAARASYTALSGLGKAVVDAVDPGKDTAHLIAVEAQISILEGEALEIANAKVALTTLPFTVAKNTVSPVISTTGITQLASETYAFTPVNPAITTPATLTGGGGAVITATTATITRDTLAPFTFKIDLVITAGSTSETVVFTVTVPTGLSDVTMMK